MALLGVYLHERVRNTLRMVEQAEAEGIRVSLWSMDPPPPELSRVTAGSGPGTRTELLNRLWELVRSAAWDMVLVADDDVAFAPGAVRALIRTTVACGFGLAQPAHARGSWIDHVITARRPLRLARETTFVEVGPAFVVARPWIDSVLPFPAGSGMGWGVGVKWQALRERGCRLGIVDAAPMRHLHASGQTYDSRPERARLRAVLADRGLTDLRETQHVLAQWWAWQARPPWRGPSG